MRLQTPQPKRRDRRLPLVFLVSCVLKLSVAGIRGDQAASKKWKLLLSSGYLVKTSSFSELANIINKDKLNIKVTFISHAVRNLLELKTSLQREF